MTPTPTRARQRLALIVLISAQFVVMLDTSLVNVALPSMQEDLGLSHAGLAWVVNSYFLAFGGFLLVAGRLADVVGRRSMFMAGGGLFTAATLLAGFAGNEAVLLVARTLQGVGAAALSPAALSMLLVAFQGASRAKAMSGWGAASTLGGATGVVLGGALTAAFGWSWVFFVTVPVTVAGLVATPWLFSGDDRQEHPRRFDALGATAVTVAALGIIYAALAAPEWGLLSLPTLLGGGVAVGALVLFVAVERRAADPIVPLALFRSPSVAIGVGASILGGSARATSFFLVALYLQQLMGLGPDVAGLAMVPTSVAGFVVSVALLPRILKALGPEKSVVIGLVVLALGHLWLARAPLSAQYAVDVLPALLFIAAGVALSFTPSTMVIASGIPTERSGLASGLSNASSQMGAAIGVAALGAILAAHIGPEGAGEQPAIAAGFTGAFATAAGLALSAAALASVLVLTRSTSDRRHEPAVQALASNARSDAAAAALEPSAGAGR